VILLAWLVWLLDLMVRAILLVGLLGLLWLLTLMVAPVIADRGESRGSLLAGWRRASSASAGVRLVSPMGDPYLHTCPDDPKDTP
jgi:hypothetical protein